MMARGIQTAVAGELRPLFVDNHLLAVCKPAGLLCVPDRTGAPSLVELAGRWLCEHTPGAGHVLSVHRLDRPVSGVVVFARTTKGAQRLGRAFASGLARKAYLARTEPLGAGAPLRALCRAAPRGEVTVWMAHAGRTVRASLHEFDGARPATTRWALRGWLPDGGAALSLEPEGGKRHQLRAAAAVGLRAPLLGDVRYGAAGGGRHGLDAGAVALHAHSLALPHPTATCEAELGERAAGRAGAPLEAEGGSATCWTEEAGEAGAGAGAAGSVRSARGDDPRGADVVGVDGRVRAKGVVWLCLRAPPPGWWPLAGVLRPWDG